METESPSRERCRPSILQLRPPKRDEGTLRKLNASIRHHNVVGDTNTVHGKVVKKYIEDGEHLADLEVQNENQSGLATALGRATVALPYRDA